MTDSLSPIANHLWQSTLFAGLAGLLTLALRKNPARVRCWVWVAASLKFLLPFALLVTIGELFEWRMAPVIAPSVSVVMQQVGQPFAAKDLSSPVLAATPPAANLLPAILFGVWACGFVGVSISWLVRWRRIAAAVRDGSPVQLGLPIRAISSPSVLEPGVLGVFRPILLLPEGIRERLSPEQWKSVLDHELCHVRYRDNLIALVQMSIEAAFWFHPLVWWIGKRIVRERERACDEEVLRMGNEPKAYAQGILKVCELYLESPVACVAGVSGSDLKQRIEEIMNNRTAIPMNAARKALLVVGATAGLLAPLTLGILRAPAIQAQPPSDAAKFEVASIKPTRGSGGGSMRPMPGRLTASAPLHVLMQAAYQIQDFQILGGPDWIRSDVYAVDAKASGTPNPAQMMLMLQSLLQDRFQLRIRRESRVMPVYELAPARGGLKLPSASEGSCVEKEPPPPGLGDPPPKPMCGDAEMHPAAGGWHMVGGKVPMAEFVRRLIEVLGRTVIDRTGFSGVFDINLEFRRDETTDFARRAGMVAPAEALPAATSGPSIFSAVRQLGLRLESAKAPVEVLVIDHVERPSEN